MKSFEEQIAEQQTGTATAMEPMRGPHIPGWNEVTSVNTATTATTTGVAAIAEPDAVEPETTEELYTTRDIAAVLGASYGCVRWYLDRGYIKAKHVPSGGRFTFVVKRSDLLKWLDKPGQRAKFKTLHWDRLQP
jgi:hypothetical protein